MVKFLNMTTNRTHRASFPVVPALVIAILLLAADIVSRAPVTRRIDEVEPPQEVFAKTAVFVAYDRADYFAKAFDAFFRAEGAKDYDVMVFVDGEDGRKPGDAFDRTGWLAIQDRVKNAEWLVSRNLLGARSVSLHLADRNLGVWANKKRAVSAAMKRGDFAIVLEDDVVVAKDAIGWLEFPVASGLVRSNPRIATATCWSTSFPATNDPTLAAFDRIAVANLGMRDTYFENPWSTPWGWSIWRSTWDAVGEEWTGQDSDLARLVRQLGWTEVMPLLARCDNVGKVGSTMRGSSKDPVHARALTSDDIGFGDTGGRFAEAPSTRGSVADGVVDTERIYSLVRHGIEVDDRSAGRSLRDLEADLGRLGSEFVVEDPVWYA